MTDGPSRRRVLAALGSAAVASLAGCGGGSDATTTTRETSTDRPSTATPDTAHSRNDFFESEECMAMYKDWVRTFLTHENPLTGLEYRNDPTIAMWELGNEIQHSPPRVGESIRPWFEEAGAFVKSLDDRTLVTTGSYGHQGRNAFVDEARADPIDVVSVHYYPGPAHYDMPEDEVIPTLSATVETAREEIGKPLYVGEYNWGVDVEERPPFPQRRDWLRRIHRELERAGVAATNLHNVRAGERSDYGTVTLFAGGADPSWEELARHVEAMTAASSSSCL